MTQEEYSQAYKNLENGACFSPRECSMCHTKLWICKRDDEYYSDSNCACVNYHVPMRKINLEEGRRRQMKKKVNKKTITTCIELTQVNKNYIKRKAKQQDISMREFINVCFDTIRKLEKDAKK